MTEQLSISDDSYDLKKYAELDSPPAEKICRVWTGVYKGIRFEINNYAFEDGKPLDKWTHYLWLRLDDQLPKEKADSFWLKPREERFRPNGRPWITYDYYDSPVGKIEFHGGCTWFSKESTEDEPSRVIKIGCDYQHIWDEGRHHTVGYIYEQVQVSIDSFLDQFGPVKVRSWGDGLFRFIEEFK